MTYFKFCTHCKVGDQSLEDCPTMLEKINTKKNVNVFSCVQKNDLITTKIYILSLDKEQKQDLITPELVILKTKNVYPDPMKEKQTYK